ncbi:MAG: hypothetical protein L3J46_04390, partial [Kangiellaceae bacterium]|nr:hypothetical protein [Kangiellaceae bacterium]
MKTKIVIVVIMLVLFFFLLPEPEQIISAEQQEKPTDYSSLSENFIIQNVRIYDGETLFEKADIHIEKFRVKSIGKEIPITKNISHYDGSGKTLLPGFIDSHTHAYGNALKDALNFGVTTELDMFTMPEFANSFQSMREQTSNNQHSDLFSSTILATTEGGHGTEYGFKIPVLADTSQAEHFVKERIAQGADYIKAVYNSKKAM